MPPPEEAELPLNVLLFNVTVALPKAPSFEMPPPLLLGPPPELPLKVLLVTVSVALLFEPSL